MHIAVKRCPSRAYKRPHLAPRAPAAEAAATEAVLTSMSLQQKQRQVLLRIGAATAITATNMSLACVVQPPTWLPLPSSSQPADMLAYAVLSSLPIFLVVMQMMILVGTARFTGQNDIDAAATTAQPSPAVRIRTAVLQNTVEQAVLLFGLHLAWAVVMPYQRAIILLASTVQFVVGRQLFLAGYKHGAPGRALGFALTFQPSKLMAAWMVAKLLGWVS